VLLPVQGTYLAFLGRISPEKRVDRALEIARRTGMPLKIAAKVDPVRDGTERLAAAALYRQASWTFA
jgi:glycosyltransferase involved in cell wall biosynthesis